MKKTEVETMTIEEFNENYWISVCVKAFQKAKLTDMFLDYDSVDEVVGVLNYTVYAKEDHEEVLHVETDREVQFVEELVEHFNITGVDTDY